MLSSQTYVLWMFKDFFLQGSNSLSISNFQKQRIWLNNKMSVWSVNGVFDAGRMLGEEEEEISCSN